MRMGGRRKPIGIPYPWDLSMREIKRGGGGLFVDIGLKDVHMMFDVERIGSLLYNTFCSLTLR
jgi:hypothetical protein